VGERHWDRRSLFWLESLPVGAHAVPELERPAPHRGAEIGEGPPGSVGPAEAV
jgi:hypothetical protein